MHSPAPRLIGRAGELTTLHRMVRDHRLVTVTGVGGVGKTRLAFEALAGLDAHFAGRVAVCELAAEPTAETVATVLATRLGLPSIDAAATALADTPMLVVVDSCEHVIDAAARVVSALLRRAPAVHVLATSREPLGVAGERVLPVGTLPVPDTDEPEDVERSPAAALLLGRARAAGASIDLSTQAPSVARVCRRLDGLPLALELAAARARTLTPREIEEHLDERFVLLEHRRMRGHPRHHSLRAAVDWSYDLLDSADRRLFDALGVFEGDFTLEAAHHVGGVDGDGPLQTLDRLDGLVQRSLVTVRQHRGLSRYALLETLRDYARGRLQDRGELDATRDRALDHMVDTARRLHVDIARTMRCQDGLRLLDEYDTLRNATLWCVDHDPRPDRALALFCPQWVVIHNTQTRAVVELGRRVLRRRPDAESPDWPTAVATTANALLVVGDLVGARRLLDHIVPVTRVGFAAADARRGLAMLEAAHGRLSDALAWAEEGAAAAEAAGLQGVATEFAGTRAQLLHELGRSGEALALIEEMREEADRLGSGNLAVKADVVHGSIVAVDDPAGARRLLDRAVRTAEDGGPYLQAASHRALGAVALLHGDVAQAASSLRAALDVFVSSGNDAETWWTLRWVAALLVGVGRGGTARELLRGAPHRPAPLFLFLLEHRHLERLLGDLAGPEVCGTPARGQRDHVSRARRELAAFVEESHDDRETVRRVAPSPPANVFRRAGGTCTITYAGTTAHLRDSKGLADIAALLANAGRDVHCLELMGSPLDECDTGPVIDDVARTAYRRRARALQEELDEAEAWGDAGRASRARDELEALIDQVSAGTALGGRVRRSGASAERARSAVRWRIAAALRKIREVHEPAHDHLQRSLRTGTRCAYEPAEPTTWQTSVALHESREAPPHGVRRALTPHGCKRGSGGRPHDEAA